MDSGRPQAPKRYYRNMKDNDVYRVDAYGFSVHTGIRRIIIKNIRTGERWDMPESALQDTALVNNKIINVWVRLPDEPPMHERPYPGYIDDPRDEELIDGYNAYGIKQSDTRPGSTNSRPTSTEYDGGKRTGFR